MPSLALLHETIAALRAELAASAPTTADVDSVSLLKNLAEADAWGEAQWASVDFLAKRLDISRKLLMGYTTAGRAQGDVLGEPARALATAIFLKAALLETAMAMKPKRFNAVFKAIDFAAPAWLVAGQPLHTVLEDAWSATLASLPASEVSPHHAGELPAPRAWQTLPLTVLFYEGPIARAYLETIYQLGFKPQKIIHLVAARDIATKKPVARWLPKAWRTAYAASIQKNKIHYWPKALARKFPALVQETYKTLAEKLFIPASWQREAMALHDVSRYADHIEPILIDGLGDTALQAYIEQEPESTWLFTGGGIVPAALLSVPQVKLLHIHPGFLPAIRGADCALWSTLLTGHSSATCFYMDAGVDTGDIIMPCWLPAVAFPATGVALSRDDRYRMMYGYVDPWVRAYVLRELLLTHQSFQNLPASTQHEEDGITYHFMHARLKDAALARFYQD